MDFEGTGRYRDIGKGNKEEREEALLSANQPSKIYPSSWLHPPLRLIVSGLYMENCV